MLRLRDTAVQRVGREAKMALLNVALTQLKIWSAYSKLSSADGELRMLAISALCDIGPAAIPCLRFATNPLRPPRTQYAAAVALHRLGEPAGMVALTDAVTWRLPGRPDLHGELKWAFLGVGAPTAVDALIDILPLLPPHDPAVLQFVVNVWAGLRDPRALEIMASPQWPAHDLFVQAIPEFGDVAIPHLKRIARDPVAGTRLLAIRAMRRLENDSITDALSALLCDIDPLVRQEAASALYAAAPTRALRAISSALLEGFSSRSAVDVLTVNAPALYEPLLALIERWQPGVHDEQHDTRDAVVAALNHLSQWPSPSQSLARALWALLSRTPDPAMTAMILRMPALGMRIADLPFGRLRAVLTEHLTRVDGEVRQEAANLLVSNGDFFGRDLIQRLADSWPRGSLMARLHAILRGGPDAGQAANQAVQQVSQWLTRLSRHAVVHLSAKSDDLDDAPASSYDPRLPATLQGLLRNALGALRTCDDYSEMEELLSLTTAVIACMETLSSQDVATVHDELLQALYTVKYGVSVITSETARREVGEVIRTAAASFFLDFHGPSSFGLFLCALYVPTPEVHGTAIMALGRLGDARALPYLQELAAGSHPVNAARAQDAVAMIRRTNPAVMALLRASQQTDSRQNTLLRAANGKSDGSHPDMLLRPTAEGQ